MKRFIPVLAVIAAIYVYQGFSDSGPQLPRDEISGVPASDPVFVDGRLAEGSGKVVRILPDDNDGSRHQRFILQMASGRTLLVAHNIDLAPRIGTLRKGDTVEFFGEFQSNAQGGVIHWTHHDPQRRHPDGWLRHGGRTYQ